MSNFLFFPKNIVQTSGVIEVYEQGKLSLDDLSVCLSKHFRNQGEECESDNLLNEQAIEEKSGRVFSSFNVKGVDLFIITEGLHLANEPFSEYPLCTILLPFEY